MSFATYKFLPWARRGMSAYISEPDTLGKAEGDAVQRASVRLALEFNQAADLTETNDLNIIGPGDIVGIKADMIIRTEPLDSVAGFEPNYLPYVEFYDEDFPWRYTPARAVDTVNGTMKDGVLRPWLALILLKANEFEDTKRRQPLPSIVVTNPAALPPHDELHLWAHAHSNISDGGNQTVLEDFLESLEENYKKDPDGLYSRILCPRRLEADTYYHAFVVPTYETGRLAGLGRPIKDTKAQKPAWGPNSTDFELPVYHRWGFRTGLNFDFESLVRLLEPRVMDDKVGVRPMDVSSPAYKKASGSGDVSPVDPKIMYLEGALLAPQTKPDPLELTIAQPFVHELKELINLNITNQENTTEDPIVTVPFYGMYHAMEVLNTLPDFDPANVQEAGVDITKWQNELNRDPRWRVAAGFGTRMVQENQEKFMDSAWKQLKNVLEANKKMQSAQMAAKVGNRMYEKHLAPLAMEKVLGMTRAVSARVDALPLAVEKETFDPNQLSQVNILDGPIFKTKATAKSAINASPLPAAALTHPFRRAMRVRGKLMRGLEKAYVEEPVIKSADAPTARALAGFPVGFQAQMLQTTINGLNGENISAAPKIQFSQLGNLNKGDLSAGPLALQDIRVWSIKSNTDEDFIYNLPDFNGGLPSVNKWKFLFGPNVNKPNVVFDFDPVSNWNFLGGVTKFSDIFKLGPLAPNAAPRDPAAPPPPGLDDAFGTMNLRKGYDEPLKFTVVAPLSTLSDNTKITLKPSIAYRQMLRHQVKFGSLDNKVSEDFLPVMAYPDYPEPTYEYLVKIDKELLLPNLDLIPPNTLSLLRTNQKFIESYLVGLNYEMGRELLWREYPTDMRGSYFRQFWDVSGIVAPDTTAIGSEAAKDIKPIHTWLDKTKKEKWPLGRHNARDAQGDASQLVFVVRGELLKKYPNAVIFAQKAIEKDGKKQIDQNLADADFKADILFPIYKAEISPDIKLFGFDLTIEQAAGIDPGPDPSNTDKLGWFFVIAEVPGEPRFGMDLTYNEGNEETWDDISWQNFSEPLDFIRANKIPGNAGPNPDQEFNKNQSLNGAKGHWARSSADMANILFQRPVMIAVHATEMLDQDILDDNKALDAVGAVTKLRVHTRTFVPKI